MAPFQPPPPPEKAIIFSPGAERVVSFWNITRTPITRTGPYSSQFSAQLFSIFQEGRKGRGSCTYHYPCRFFRYSKMHRELVKQLISRHVTPHHPCKLQGVNYAWENIKLRITGRAHPRIKRDLTGLMSCYRSCLLLDGTRCNVFRGSLAPLLIGDRPIAPRSGPPVGRQP